MKKLFEVEISGHIYVMAETAREAESHAEYNIDDNDIDCHAMVPDYEGVWDGWGDSEPYNSDDRRKVSEILIDMQKERKRKEFEASCPKLPGFEQPA